MQYIRINRSTTLAQLSDMVGSRNVDIILNYNSLFNRVPNIGQAFYTLCSDTSLRTSIVSVEKKDVLLKKYAKDFEVFEYTALLNEDGWKILSSLGTLPGMLAIPENINIPLSANTVGGNNEAIGTAVFASVIDANLTPPHYIDPSLLNEYKSFKSTQISDMTGMYNTISSSVPGVGRYDYMDANHRVSGANPSLHFGHADYSGFLGNKVQFTEVALYSTLSNSYVYFPVYPEELSDSASANYITMPDILYQYEPWHIYESSGPRTNSYTFFWHRDIWGNHNDGNTNKIIRFCEANCYPRYNGSLVNTSTVRLYFKGKILISGILTKVSVDWDGPLGHDGWYLCCKLTLDITEISEKPLNYDTVMKKELIG